MRGAHTALLTCLRCKVLTGQKKHLFMKSANNRDFWLRLFSRLRWRILLCLWISGRRSSFFLSWRKYWLSYICWWITLRRRFNQRLLLVLSELLRLTVHYLVVTNVTIFIFKWKYRICSLHLTIVLLNWRRYYLWVKSASVNYFTSYRSISSLCCWGCWSIDALAKQDGSLFRITLNWKRLLWLDYETGVMLLGVN